MDSKNKLIRVLMVASLLAGGLALNAEAAVIKVVPSLQTVPAGAVSADIVIEELDVDEVVGALDIFDIGFNGAVLTGTTIAMDPGNVFFEGFIGYEFGDFGVGGSSPAFISMSADPSCDFACLKATQGAGFTLATLNFTGLTGFSPITLNSVFVYNADGVEPIAATIEDGAVCVGTAPCPTVPEPASLSLLGLALGAALMSRRRTATRRVE